jgi:hypothetical protein
VEQWSRASVSGNAFSKITGQMPWSRQKRCAPISPAMMPLGEFVGDESKALDCPSRATYSPCGHLTAKSSATSGSGEKVSDP